jgi:hypothetical protein
MRKILLAGIIAIATMIFVSIDSCRKSINDNIIEPITVVKPDSLNLLNIQPGTVQAVNLIFTTDRPIVWAKCMYEVDSNGLATNLYPDTLFFKVLDSIPTQLTNKYTYSGSYLVPQILHYPAVVRFDVRMEAFGNPSSPDTLYYDKQFSMTVL